MFRELKRRYLKRCNKVPTSVKDFGVTEYVTLENDVKYGVVDIVSVKGYEYYFLVKENDIDDWGIRKSIDEDGKGYLVGLKDEAEFYLLSRYIMDPTRRKSNAMKRLMIFWANGHVKKKRLFDREFVFFLIALSCISLLLGYFISTYGWFKTSAKLPPDNNAAYTDGSLIKTHIGELKLLGEPYWSELSMHERLDVMQCVANIEATYLGLPEVLIVKTGKLEEGVIGEYYPTSKMIVLSTDYLMSKNNCGYSNLEVLLNGVFHSYQYWLVAAYNTIDAKYKELQQFEFIKDHDSDVAAINRNGNVYYWSTIEERADSFAGYTVREYMKMIAMMEDD